MPTATEVGIAPGFGNPGGVGDQGPAPGQLRQAVDPRPRVLWTVVGRPGVGVGQAMVGAEVDDRHLASKPGGERGRLAVRQGQEHQVGLPEGRGVGGGHHLVGQRRQRGVHLPDPATGLAPGSHQPRAQRRVAEQEPEQLTPGIAGGTGDGYPNGHGSECIRKGAYSCKRVPDP